MSHVICRRPGRREPERAPKHTASAFAESYLNPIDPTITRYVAEHGNVESVRRQWEGCCVHGLGAGARPEV